MTADANDPHVAAAQDRQLARAGDEARDHRRALEELRKSIEQILNKLDRGNGGNENE